MSFSTSAHQRGLLVANLADASRLGKPRLAAADVLAWINDRPGIDHFDKMRLRLRKYPSDQWLDRLRSHCHRAYPHRGEPNGRGYRHLSLIVIAPRPTALEMLAEKYLKVIEAEVARNRIFRQMSEALYAIDFYTCHFLHPGTGEHFTIWINSVTGGVTVYTRWTERGKAKRGLTCVWYADPERPCKVTGADNCFKFEIRGYGTPTVRDVLGIETTADLPGFDLTGTLAKYERLVDVDLAHLGRQFLNDEAGRDRRNKPWQNSAIPNLDRVAGNIQFLRNSIHPKYPLIHSIQSLVVNYGTGPFLHHIPTEPSRAGARAYHHLQTDEMFPHMQPR